MRILGIKFSIIIFLASWVSSTQPCVFVDQEGRLYQKSIVLAMAHRLSRGSSIDHNEKPNIILFLPTLLNKRAFYPMISPISKFTTYWWKFSDSIIVHPKFFQVYQTTNNSWLLKKKFIVNQSKAKTEKTKINTLQESLSQ